MFVLAVATLGETQRRSTPKVRPARTCPPILSALQSAVQRGDKQGIADCLDVLADLSAARGDWSRAARAWGAVDELRDRIGARRPPLSSAAHEQQIARAVAAVGEATLDEWMAQGRSLSAEEAVAVDQEAMAVGRDTVRGRGRGG
jgi:hypothetical protein